MKAKNSKIFLLFLTVVTFIFSFAALSSCGSGKKAEVILGSGASFPYPLYAKMFEEYRAQKKVTINYQSIGSGGGIRQLLAETTEFGATDAFIKDNELVNAPRTILHIPIVLGGIAVTYNADVGENIKLDGKTLADIFMGKITKWNDVAIAELNPEKRLSEQNIIVVRRSDGSGTTSAFTTYLDSVSDEWSRKYGAGKSIEWFDGSIGSKGNEGVAGQISSTEGSIGYLNLNYAITLGMDFAKIKNEDGNFILPSVSSVTEASVGIMSPDTRVNISASPVRGNGYPISTFTWIVFYQEQNYNERTIEEALALKSLVRWMVGDGQSYAEDLYYSPLPEEVQGRAFEILDSMTYDGKAL